MELEKRMEELRDLLYRKISLEKKMQELSNEAIYLREKKHELYNKLEREDIDIKEIENNSIIYLWYELFTSKGKNVSKITHDYKLTSDLYELIHTELAELKNKLARMDEYQAEYNHLINEKETLVLEKEQKNGEEIERYEKEIIKYKNHIRDINETIQAGKNVYSSLKFMLDLIKQAKNWGTIDIFGRGLFNSITKTDIFKQTAEKIRLLPYYENKLIRELKIIHFYMNINIDISLLIKFNDYLNNELYHDITNKQKLIAGIDRINEIYHYVEEVMNHLTKQKEQYLLEVKRIEHEKQKLM